MSSSSFTKGSKPSLHDALDITSTPRTTLHLSTLPTSATDPFSSSTSNASYPPPSPSIHSSYEKPLPQLPPPDRGVHAHVFLAVAFVVEVVVWGLPSAFGVFLEYYSKNGIGKQGKVANETLLPWVGTLCQGLMLFFGPPLAWILNPRPRLRLPFVWSGAVILSLSLLASSFARNTFELLLFQGVGFSIGGAMVFYPAMWFLNEWFIARRGLASGITYCGTAIGGLIYPFYVDALLRRSGDAVTLQALAGTTAVLLAVCMPWLKPRLPIPPKKDTREERRDERGRRSAELRKVWKNWRWGSFMVANVMQALAFTLATLFIPSYASSIGLSGAAGSAALACINASSIFSRIYVGVLSDRSSPHRIAAITMAASAVSVFLLWGVASTTLAPLLVFSLAFGLTCGPWTCLYASLIKDVAGDDLSLAATLFGAATFTRGVGTIITAFISSILFAHPLTGAKASTGFGIADGKFGSVVLFTGVTLVVAAMSEGAAML